MRLKILLPDEVFLDEEASAVVAEGLDGSFCLLPRHVDFASALAPGLLSFQARDGERFVALDEGVLIKWGQEVLISTRNAIQSPDLQALERLLREKVQALDERERLARSALARLEASIARNFVELGRQGHE